MVSCPDGLVPQRDSTAPDGWKCLAVPNVDLSQVPVVSCPVNGVPTMTAAGWACPIPAPFRGSHRAVNAATTLDASADYFVEVNATTVTPITLPAATAAGLGRSFVVLNAGRADVSISAQPGERINGSSAMTLTPDRSVALTCTGTNWVATIQRDPGRLEFRVSSTNTALDPVSDQFLEVDATASAVDVALPSLSSVSRGRQFIIRVSGTTPVTVNAQNPDTIGGAPNLLLPPPTTAHLVAGSTGWIRADQFSRPERVRDGEIVLATDRCGWPHTLGVAIGVGVGVGASCGAITRLPRQYASVSGDADPRPRS